MFSKYRSWILLFFDLLVIVVAYYLALWIRFDFSFEKIKYFHQLTSLIPYIVIINFLIFKLFKMDKTLWRHASIEEALRIAFSVFAGFLLNFIFIQYLVEDRLPISMHIIALFISLLVIEFMRFLYRIFRHFTSISYVHNPDFKKVLIIGAGDAGLMVLKELLHNKELKNNIIGFVDDSLFKKGRIISGFPILGTTEDLGNIIEKNGIQQVYIAIPSASVKRQNEIVKICYENKVEVKILSNASDLMSFSNLKNNIRSLTIMDLLGRKEIELDNNEIQSLIKDRVVLVSGAGGSIGSELCYQILNYSPKTLVMFDINENTLYDLQTKLNILKREGKIPFDMNLEFIVTSIRDISSLEKLFLNFQPNVVFHAAAHKHVPFMELMPQEAIKNNILGTFNMIELSKQYNVTTFVSISTDKAVNPTSVMGATKRFNEKLVQAIGKNSSTKFVSVRFGNVLGSNGSVVPLFRKQIESGGPVTVTHKDMVRYFMTISEAVSLVIQAASFGEGGEVFVLDMGEPLKILDIAEKMIELSGLIPYKDIKIIFTGLRPGEKLYEELLMNEEGLRPTANKLIFVAKPMDLSEELILSELKVLENASNGNHSNIEIKQVLNQVVDTYQPDLSH